MACLSRVDYALLARQIRSLLSGEPDFIANAANFAAAVYEALPDINWAGFYFARSGELVLGPFCGKPACTRLPLGRGVCGESFARAQTIVVDDVDRFAGHIACDSASRSEITVPLLDDGKRYGVFDIDSPQPARFSEIDRAGIETLVATFVELSKAI